MTLAVFTAVLDAATLTAGAAWWRHRRKPPVPEAATPPRADAAPGLPAHPVRAAPAPGLTPPDIHIELWVDCGRSRVYNSGGETVGGRDCGCPGHNDWDTAMREELTP